ncbi:MAG: HlyC/CorC family transporter [Anaerolineae bacterium]|nr:HlyC/CorC family transporter [Anaerolineae bacterium]
MPFWITITITIILMIAANALYVAAEFATVSARKSRINQMALSGNRLAKMLLPIVEDKTALDNYVAACQVGITLSSLVLGAYGQNAIATALAPLLTEWGLFADLAALSVSTTIVLVVLTTLQVMMGELLPKSVAIQNPERLALLTLVPVRWSEFLFRPLIWLLNGSGNAILKILNINARGENENVHSPREIELLVTESHEVGLLDDQEQQLLRNALHLRGLIARQVMIPRTRLLAAPISQSVDDLLVLATDNGKTRIPVYETNIDTVVGFVHLKDLFRLHLEGEQDIEPIIRHIEQIPETMPILQVWDMLDRKQQYLAIVFDEYGGTVGMITFEDLIEEVFGEVQDEFDTELPLISSDDTGRIHLRGELLVADVNEYLSLRLPEDVADTLGGLIFNGVGQLPEPGAEVTLGSPEVTLRVEAVEQKQVTEVSLQLPDQTPPHVAEWEPARV